MAATERPGISALVGAAALCLVACEDPGGLRIEDPEAPSDAGPQWGSDELGEEGNLPDTGLPETEGSGSDEEGGEVNPTFVEPGATWRYETGAAASPEWMSPAFDDSAWSEGPAPLGALLQVATPIPAGPARFRTSFEVEDPGAVSGLNLRLRRDDGAVVWLNGTEVFRTNVPASPSLLEPSVYSLSETILYDAFHYYHAFPDPALLVPGTNTLAVAIHGYEALDPDSVLDALLRAHDPSAPPEVLTCRVRTTSYGGKYGPRHVGAIWIEDAQGIFVRSLEVWGDVRREHLVTWVSASAENDVDAITYATRRVHGTHQATWDLLRADGTPATPGLYRLRAEITEVNSNGNAAPGPTMAIDFELGAGPTLITELSAGDPARFTDILLYSP